MEISTTWDLYLYKLTSTFRCNLKLFLLGSVSFFFNLPVRPLRFYKYSSSGPASAICLEAGGWRCLAQLINCFARLYWGWRGGRAKLIHEYWEQGRPRENRLSLRFCRNNVIFLGILATTCMGEIDWKYFLFTQNFPFSLLTP